MAADRNCWVNAAPDGPSFTCAGVPAPVWVRRQACTQCSGRVGDVLKRMGFGYQPFKTVEDYFQYTMVRLYRGDEPLKRQPGSRSALSLGHRSTTLTYCDDLWWPPI